MREAGAWWIVLTNTEWNPSREFRARVDKIDTILEKPGGGSIVTIGGVEFEVDENVKEIFHRMRHA